MLIFFLSLLGSDCGMTLVPHFFALGLSDAALGFGIFVVGSMLRLMIDFFDAFNIKFIYTPRTRVFTGVPSLGLPRKVLWFLPLWTLYFSFSPVSSLYQMALSFAARPFRYLLSVSCCLYFSIQLPRSGVLGVFSWATAFHSPSCL